MEPIIKHFTDDDLYKFTMCCAVIKNFPRARVKYEFIDRKNSVYPLGFAAALSEQIEMLEDLAITEEEVAFLRSRCSYIPSWFCTYLRGFRYRKEWARVSQDASGHLSVEFEGLWADTILLEVKVLAIISELYYNMTGQAANADYEDFYRRSCQKGERLLEAGCVFSDFGTRRRLSHKAEDTLVKAMTDCMRSRVWPGVFCGTSNIWFAMKYGVTPIGTMAHEFVCAIAAMYGPTMANHIAMDLWRNTFRGALGTFLYDTYGWEIFSLNFSEDFARLFKGLRVDSGDNREQMRRIVEKYRSLGIDPKSKQIIFSNSLDTDEAIALNHDAKPYCQPSFGIGTHFTNDFPGIKPLNIVIKLVAAKITEQWTFYSDTCKLSEDHGKYTGKPEVVRRFMDALHL
ncbi:MAG: nicotinate phosphoribosyltransferase [Clostridium sp.]|nr:nicotinate phosphoribosyltransferase [Clostridium sp.]